MRYERHGKPPTKYLETLRKPLKKDYEKLVHACVEAIVQGEKDVLIAFSYILKFPEGFPRGILEYKDGTSNIHRIKARKLLVWLNEQGHTEITLQGLRYQAMMLGQLTSFLNNFEDVVDIDQEMSDNVHIVTEEGE
jgi:hypothetical protein